MDKTLTESFNLVTKYQVHQCDFCYRDGATCRREVFRWLVSPENTKRLSANPMSTIRAKALLPATLCSIYIDRY